MVQRWPHLLDNVQKQLEFTAILKSCQQCCYSISGRCDELRVCILTCEMEYKSSQPCSVLAAKKVNKYLKRVFVQLSCLVVPQNINPLLSYLCLLVEEPKAPCLPDRALRVQEGEY